MQYRWDTVGQLKAEPHVRGRHCSAPNKDNDAKVLEAARDAVVWLSSAPAEPCAVDQGRLSSINLPIIFFTRTDTPDATPSVPAKAALP
jgi:hypothetical protein